MDKVERGAPAPHGAGNHQSSDVVHWRRRGQKPQWHNICGRLHTHTASKTICMSTHQSSLRHPHLSISETD